MTKILKEICPLCGSDAEFEYIKGDAKKRQYFYCKQCIEFVITDTVKRKLSRMPIKQKRLSSLSTSLPEDKVLHIFFDEREIKKIVENRVDWR